MKDIELNKNFYYEFDTINNIDYKCLITYMSKQRNLIKIFEKIRRKARKKGKDLPPNLIEESNSFNIPKDMEGLFYPAVLLAIKKNINDIFKEVNKDGIFPMNEFIINVHYDKKQSGGWKIKVLIGGQYTKNAIEVKRANKERY